MEVIQYQDLAARTINPALTHEQMQDHALKGMVGEIGEINSIYQKVYQGHEFDEEHDFDYFCPERNENCWESEVSH